jgi:hypothetical protein
MAQNVSKTTTDHEAIRGWVEERGGWPAEVEATAGTEGRTGIIRIDFPGFSGEGTLRRISWDEWFRKFDEASLAFVYEDATAGGERSSFNELVARETAKAEGRRTSRRGAGRGRARTAARGAARSTARPKAPKRGAAARGGARPGAKRGAAKGAGGRRTARAEAARTTTRRGTARRGASRRKPSRRGR